MRVRRSRRKGTRTRMMAIRTRMWMIINMMKTERRRGSNKGRPTPVEYATSPCAYIGHMHFRGN